MPHVLHVISGLAVGGAELAMYRLVSGSHGREYTHMVVSLTPDAGIGKRLREAGIELKTFDFKSSPVSHFIDLLALIKKRRPDVVQTWLYHADILGGLAARLSGIRNVVWGIRTTELTNGDARATVAVRKICAWLSPWLPHTIICVAEASRRTHVRVGYDPSRMIVVPNGFDLSYFDPGAEQRDAVREECGFAADHIVIGTLGRFNAAKDQHNFVQAAGLVAQRNDSARFLMVGRNVDAGNRELMDAIRRTGHLEKFALLGERAEVRACLSGMDIFCLSSRAEGFPNVVGEAMAMQLPCVVTDVGDAALLVGDTGAVVPREDPHALAKELASILKLRPDARREMGKRARARIEAEFAIERTRERFEAIYQRLTEEGDS